MRNLAAAAQRAAGLPSNGVQGMVIEREALDELVERLASLPAAERSSVPGIKPARADLILAGAVVVQGVLQAGGFDGSGDDRGGAARGSVLRAPARRAATPPLFEDVRRTSVLNLAARYHVDAAHTRHVAALALGMFDELARLGLHDGDARERELLWAASMLHDIGMSVDYDDHHKHSRYLILNGGLPGFSPSRSAIIAQAARYHRKGMPEPGPLAALFGDGDAARLNRCAVLLRLAEDLERSRDQLVRGVDIALLNGGPDGDGEGRAARDRRRRVGRSPLGGQPRDRAVRPRLPPRLCPSRPKATALACAAASARSCPAQSNSARPYGYGTGLCQTDGASSLHARRTATRGAIAPAQGVLAAEQHVARLSVGHQAREAGAVEGRVGAAVAAQRARVQAEQHHRGGRVGGDGQQRPARAGIVGAHVVGQRAVDPEIALADAVCAGAGVVSGSGGRERALGRRQPGGGRVGSRRDEQQEEGEARSPAPPGGATPAARTGPRRRPPGAPG